ncbi:protein-glutamate O-methyltransferase CheR [Thalassotalea euphylliae]|uniref:Chemotaxis protein methyltransferase n=1 Tax=Thalassotalea euphylliae TaxID=1655234 RepID=A0A3E0TQ60_9GAMM|nr:protein-glutamate O-methyltransferase CheR [Thalassotalea euphylliae]REL26583.1 protein-glutamate O-methyltransferase CheR [Thalassotalea euphylliae]
MSEVREAAYQLSSKNFKFICEYVYNAAGIVLGEAKREMVYRRLTRVIRERKLADFDAYCDLLRSQPEQEKTYFINAITTNLTSFYREQHHFDYLTEHEFPKLLDERRDTKRIRLWSSASSTGEEPYSLAITTHQSFSHVLNRWDVKILATDIDSNVLATADQGVYTTNRIEGLTQSIQQRYFKKGTGANASKVKVTDDIRSLVTFKQLNLLHEWPMSGPFDVIFCRNVIIYFDKATQQDLFARYYDMLAPGGLLMLGHSENLGEYQRYFENVGRTIFRKPV